MGLRNSVCHRCSLRDKKDKTLFLISAENSIDLGDIPSHLPKLSQIEEEIIAHCYV
jgi:hypothetical protein